MRAPCIYSFILATAGLNVAVAEEFELNLVQNAEAIGALCLDGSPGGYYFRPGIGAGAKNWIIHHMGGGWCALNTTDPMVESCDKRSTTFLGTSTVWPRHGIISVYGGAQGMLSNDSNINPFWDYSMVHINYCDGASYAGNRTDAVHSPAGNTLYFRGARIIRAIFDELKQDHGLDASTGTVVLTGTSAGGLATYLHADREASWLPIGARAVAVPDAGFFLPLPQWDGKPSWLPYYQQIAEEQDVWGSVNEGCMAAYPGEQERWRCFMAPFTAPFVKTPLFMLNSLADAWQMANIVRLPCLKHNVPTNCSAAELAALRNVRTTMLGFMDGVLDKAGVGAFLDSCILHGDLDHTTLWTKQTVDGQTMRDTVWHWVTGQGPAGTKPQVIDGPWPSNKHCQAPA